MPKARKRIIKIVKENKRSNPLAQRAPSHYKELLNCIYDSVLISDADASVIEVNQRAVDSFFFSEDEFMGMPMLDLLPDADIEFLKTLKRMPATKYALIETRCRRKDGSFFPSEIAVKSVGGRGNNIAFFVRNITKRREAESQLKLVNNAVRNSLTAIIITDEEGFVRFANPAAVKIFGSEFTVSTPASKTNLSDYFIEKTLINDAFETLHAMESWRGELKVLHTNGNIIDTEVAAVPNEQDNAINGFVFSVLDITQEKAAEHERQINERNAATIAALGAACHHLAQPATVLCVNSEIMESCVEAGHKSDLIDLLDQNSKAAHDLQEKLKRLNDITLYRTEKYLELDDDLDDISNTILSLGEPSHPPLEP